MSKSSMTYEEEKKIVELFDKVPKDGIEAIKSWCKHNQQDFATETAKFFHKEKNNLNLNSVGDYLADNSHYDSENKNVLKNFINQFDFKGKDYIESLKEFLETFKVPRETPKIDVLLKSFVSGYCEQNPDAAIKSEEYIYEKTSETLHKNLEDEIAIPKQQEDILKQLRKNIELGPFATDFIEAAPGYEIKDISSQNDQAFKNLNKFLKKGGIIEENMKGVFSKVQDNNLTADVITPKSWLSKFTGYEGSVIIEKNKGAVGIQVYKPNMFSKWFLGEKSKIIVQPLHRGLRGLDPYNDELYPKQSLELAAQVAASFETKVTSIRATYDDSKKDLENEYKKIREPKTIELQKEVKAITENLHQNEISSTNKTPPTLAKNVEGLKRKNQLSH